MVDLIKIFYKGSTFIRVSTIIFKGYFIRFLYAPIYIVMATLTVMCSLKYPGNVLIYLFFSLCFNSLLLSFKQSEKSFFEIFLSLFLWLGFWLKFTIRLTFYEGKFFAPIGQFNFSGSAFDQSLLVASLGALGLLAAMIIRSKFYKDDPITPNDSGLIATYAKYRKQILFLYTVGFLLVAFLNATLGIYQRGSIPKTILPYGLNGIFVWLLLFGMASFSCVILNLELKIKQQPFVVVILCLLETFTSNISMLSRGMILNTSAILLGIHNQAQKIRIKTRLYYKTSIVFIAGFMFVASIFSVNYIRYYLFSDNDFNLSLNTASYVGKDTKSLFLDRWIGIEGVMSVVGHEKKGWGLWKSALEEKFQNSGTSFYDRTLINSQYLGDEVNKHHFINLPGFIAFLYYPDSLVFLFLSCFVIGIGCFAIEVFVRRFSNQNLILCSLIGQTLATRFIHFGYAPSRSYMLFGTIFINIILISVLIKAVNYCYSNQFFRLKQSEEI